MIAWALRNSKRQYATSKIDSRKFGKLNEATFFRTRKEARQLKMTGEKVIMVNIEVMNDN